MGLSFKEYAGNRDGSPRQDEHWSDALWGMHGGAKAAQKFGQERAEFGNQLGDLNTNAMGLLGGMGYAANQGLKRLNNWFRGIPDVEEVPNQHAVKTLQQVYQGIDNSAEEDLKAIVPLAKGIADKAEKKLGITNPSKIKLGNLKPANRKIKLGNLGSPPVNSGGNPYTFSATT